MLLKRIIVCVMSIFWALFAYSFMAHAAEFPQNPAAIVQTIR